MSVAGKLCRTVLVCVRMIAVPETVSSNYMVGRAGQWKPLYVRLDRVSNDGYKSCRGLRINSQALLWNSASCRRRVRALRSLSDLSLALSSNVTTLNHLIRLQGSQGIQIWKQRSHSTPLYMCFIDLQKAHDSVHRGCCVLCLHASVCRRRC